MRALAFVLVAAVALAKQEEVIAGEYIVVFKPYTPEAQREQHFAKSAVAFNASVVAQQYNINEGMFLAYHLTNADEDIAASLAQMPEVAYVEPNYVHHVDECRAQTAPRNWGLTRTINRGALPSPNRFEWSTEGCGENVDVHILDTGIQVNHVDFGGRASWTGGGDHTGEGENDQHGHGTHVASTAVGNEFGIARCARVFPQKVCNRGGSCPANAQLGGLAAVAAAARRWLETGRRIVANMSLGGLFRQASNDAVNAAWAAGASISVSAGNSNDDACGRSPASAERAYTVMATTNADQRSSFSSFGDCCQIFAPGSNIVAAWIGAPDATRSASGTSMSAPHVAGALAALWSDDRNRDNDAVERRLTELSNPNRITNPGARSPNRLLWLGCER